MSGLTLEVMPDAGAPQAGITIDGLDPGATSIVSVEVSWSDGATWNGVRGAQRLSVVGGTFVRDYVPPLNVDARYRLAVHSGPVVPEQLEATLRIESEVAWLQDPLVPRGAVPVACVRDADGLLLLSPSAGTMHRRQAVDTATPMGARLPVASIGMRQAPSDIPLHLRALPQAQGALVKAIAALIDSAGQVVLRGLPTHVPLDAVAHIVAPDVQDSPVVAGLLGPRRDWEMTVMQVRPQSLRVVVPWWTYDQVRALWQAQTYDAAKAARPGDTYLDWLRNPEVP